MSDREDVLRFKGDKVRTAEGDEALVMGALVARGWDAASLGMRAWLGGGVNGDWDGANTLVHRIHASRSALRFAPDLVAAHEALGLGPYLVEVMRSPHGDVGYAVKKLQGADAWSLLAPLLHVDVHPEPWQVFRHDRMWGLDVVSDVTRSTRWHVGAASAFVYLSRDRAMSFDDVFGSVKP